MLFILWSKCESGYRSLYTHNDQKKKKEKKWVKQSNTNAMIKFLSFVGICRFCIANIEIYFYCKCFFFVHRLFSSCLHCDFGWCTTNKFFQTFWRIRRTYFWLSSDRIIAIRLMSISVFRCKIKNKKKMQNRILNFHVIPLFGTVQLHLFFSLFII